VPHDHAATTVSPETKGVHGSSLSFSTAHMGQVFVPHVTDYFATSETTYWKHKSVSAQERGGMLACYFCTKNFPGSDRGSASEKDMFSVKLLGSDSKVFFCSPLCYLDLLLSSQIYAIPMTWEAVYSSFYARMIDRYSPEKLRQHEISYRNLASKILAREFNSQDADVYVNENTPDQYGSMEELKV
jgi:hypothetical protein